MTLLFRLYVKREYCVVGFDIGEFVLEVPKHVYKSI